MTGASGQVVFFRFKPKETQTETKFMEIPIVYEVSPIKKAPASSSTGGEKDGESVGTFRFFITQNGRINWWCFSDTFPSAF